MSGWVADPSADATTGIDQLNIVLGAPGQTGPVLARAQLGLSRPDVTAGGDDPGLTTAGFTLDVPLDNVPAGLQTLTLEARTADHGTWLVSLQVVVPTLGSVSAAQPAAAVSPPTAPAMVVSVAPRLDVAWPNPGDTVNRSLVVEGSAVDTQATAASGGGIDSIEVFIEPDRDGGGRMVGSARPGSTSGIDFNASVDMPPGPHTLYIHAHSALSGKEAVTSIPVLAR